MTLIFGLLYGMKYMQKWLKKTVFKQSIHIPEEKVMGYTKGPVDEEVELEYRTTAIDLSKNIAYEHVTK